MDETHDQFQAHSPLLASVLVRGFRVFTVGFRVRSLGGILYGGCRISKSKHGFIPYTSMQSTYHVLV